MFKFIVTALPYPYLIRSLDEIRCNIIFNPAAFDQELCAYLKPTGLKENLSSTLLPLNWFLITTINRLLPEFEILLKVVYIYYV